jgi:peptide/nickel transport system permease protein
MASMVLSRLVQAVPSLLGVTIIAFVLLHLSGDITQLLLPMEASEEVRADFRRAYGLDQPIPVQYAHYLARLVQGDFGQSFAYRRPAMEVVLERLPATLELTLTSLVVALLLTFPVGVFAAVTRGRWFDRVTTAIAFAGISLPAFWFALMLQIVFAIGLGWFPSSGRATFGGGDLVDRVQHLVLPSAVLASLLAAGWSRYLRSSMIETLAQPFVTAARARGIPARLVVLRHALRNALGPIVTIVLLDSALMVSGAVVTESVFAWPGLGSLFTEALARRDYTVLMALLMLTSTAVVALNLAADAAYALLDPRVTS